MSIFEAIILGIVQGLTEFLPISSSAHLRIVGEILPGAQDPGAAFTAITQLGTEAAVIVFFWKDIVRIITHWSLAIVGKLPRNDPDAKMGWLIILGSLPIAVLGLTFADQIENQLRSLWIVATMLIVFGILLGLADALGSKAKPLTELTWRSGLLMGCAQALALIPGVSRSGGTITAGLALGFDRQSATRYSFLLAIPAVIASGLLEAYRSYSGHAAAAAELVPTLVAAVVSFLVALVVISKLMKYLAKGSFLPFVLYRIVLGVVIMVLLSLGVLS